MPPKKNPLKELKKAATEYNNQLSKCNLILNGRKYDKYSAVQSKLEDKYDFLCQAWETNKEDILDKGSTLDEYNETDYNDTWKATKEHEFMGIYNSLSDDKPVEEPKINPGVSYEVQFVCQDMKNLMDDTALTTDKLLEDICKLADMSVEESMVQGFLQLIIMQRDRISKDLSIKLRERMMMLDTPEDANLSKDNLSETVRAFTSKQMMKLNQAQLDIAKKVKPRAVISTSSSVVSSEPVHDKVQLAKTKPPFFKGDITEYPEFKRKWNALVHPARLPVEAELDKLRDAVPKSAKEQLFACKTLAEAWLILDKRYGNQELIAKKLKDQLKELNIDGRSDPERVINLHVKVKSLVLQLTTLNMQQCLQYDAEYLAAVFNCLPSKFQDKWLDYEKTTSKWDAMMTFLDKIYDQATEQLVLLDTMGKSSSANKKKCAVEVNVLDSKKSSVNDNLDDKDEIELKKKKEKRKKLKEEIGPCPVCKAEHSFLRRDKMSWPSDRLFTCKSFKEMSAKDRGLCLEKLHGCSRCTSWRHVKSACPGQIVSCSVSRADGSKCSRDHSYLLHDSGVAYCNASKSSRCPVTTVIPDSSNTSSEFYDINLEQSTVYYIQDIPIKGTAAKARTFFDDGSNRVLIRNQYGIDAGLPCKKVSWKLKVVGQDNYETVEGNMYCAELIDNKGRAWKIWGYGIESIMKSDAPNMLALKKYFPHVPDEALEGLVEKDVDILLGLNMNHLFPAGGKGKNKHQGMRAKTSLFGCGWVLGGCHKDLEASQVNISSNAGIMRAARLQVAPVDPYSLNFWEAENMGVLPPAKCERCVACLETGTCSSRNRLISDKQQMELDVISQKTQIINNEVWCEYPFKRDPSCLKYNRNAAIKVEAKVERDLLRDEMHEVYNEQVQAILDRGAAVQLSSQEIEEWSGAVFYITHHPVLKDSVSTPVRMVSNSSFGSPSLNSILMKGPNSLNSMLDIMLRWRSWDVVVQYDLAKAYNTMHTGPQERHVRRFVWRFNPADPWSDFAFDRVHFGDVPAGCQLEVALNKTADIGRSISPVAAEKLKHDRYVDDGLSGGTRSVVQKLVGRKTHDGSYDGDLAKILEKGGFKIKALLIGGQEPNEESDLMGGKVLGYNYDVKNDRLSVKFPVNLSKKKRGVRSEPNLTEQDINLLSPKSLSKRILLGVTNGFGDFLGIASPFIIRFKVLMRQLFQVDPHLNWDSEIPNGLRAAWIDIIQEALQYKSLDFDRSCKPTDAVVNQGPVVVGFADYASEAYDARVYLRWETKTFSQEKHYSAKLALCKAKVPPLDGLTIPRGELTALCLLSRLTHVVVSALQKLDNKPTSAVLLVDSQCSINAVDSRRLMKPYFQNRVSEIRENLNLTRKLCAVEDIQYVESKLNPSDISTRATSKLKDLGPNSFHQNGPSFLCFPREKWPVSRDFDRKNIPEEEFKVSNLISGVYGVAVNECSFQPDVDFINSILGYSRSLLKVQKIAARCLRVYSKGCMLDKKKPVMDNPRSIRNQQLLKSSPNMYSVLSRNVSNDELIEVEKLLLKYSMSPTYEALEKGHLDSLLPVIDGGLVVTQGRLGDQKMLELFGVSSLPILLPNTRLAYLYMLNAHEGEFGLVHRGISSTLARSRGKVWIIRGNRLAKRICEECLVCRRQAKKLIGQQMSLIRDEQLQISPPFTHICLDFAGPVKVTDQVSKRKFMKVWILVYSCVATKAVVLLATAGYSTEDFLSKHDEFTARYGQPKTIVSDMGSQLVRSSIKVEEKDKPVNSFNWKQVTSKDFRTNWIFVPAGAQHRNGLAESTVKVMKRSLNLALQKGQVLAYAELVTLLARIATSINSRPLAISRTSSSSDQPDSLLPLTPNHLLLARSTSEPSALEYLDDDKFSRRMAYVQCLHDSWWKSWIAEVLPTLVPCKRWKYPKRNLKVDDIVMVTFPGNMTNDYRVARVIAVYPDVRNLVRTVRIAYRRKNRREPAEVYVSRPLVEEEVHVQKLSLLQSAGEPIYDGE